MIIVRNVFRLKFGEAKAVKALIPEFQALNKKHGMTSHRALMDITGESYVLVFESGHASLTEFETRLQTMFSDAEWGKVYEKFKPYINSGYREIFTVVSE
jgi:hypothetical protein